MLSIYGDRRQTCDGRTRREILQAGGAGLLGLSLPKVLAAEAVAADAVPKAKSVIFLMLFGGPSQLETFDLKPEAPDNIRGPFEPIASRTPGLLIGEHLPKTASVSDKFCVVRTMSHTFNDHSGGGHYLQTGRRWHIPIGGGFTPTPQDWPSMGSIVEYVDQQSYGLSRPMPSYMVVPNSLGRLQEAGQYPRPGEYAGWLGQRYNPATTQVDKQSLTDNPYWRDCTDEELTFQLAGLASGEGMTLDRLQTRRSLLEQFDLERRQVSVEGAPAAGYDAFQERAFALVTSERAREALDIRRAPDASRDRYGRHLFGQSCLMARRLIEADVRFVTVHYDCVDGYSWDSHRNSDDVKKHLLPTFDQAYSALLEDLEQRGLLEETLVVATGEMGRTPKANAQWGRGHWSTLFPAVLAGAGVTGGRTYGESDADAAYALDDPVSPEDLAATIYHALGISHELRVRDAQARPTPIVHGGEPLTALWS
ncbi:MAG: DUF1501 domain-containing protein [Planctomycetota bacterium]|nr:MAG: DUF1501 domain-containing protein [Planctomycetota bacterium]REJ91672.1 MAG: DUF1501 domain-containing protein [Planctomycetota bacterium]REK19960.1 MAG: DUF1501 domain-containing protein [Planctomycetota bacterium]REK27527.1 MAG: DUF1501 domain-containing protein [Planctomycetota bacterium]